MPTFEITSPDGARFEITAPEGATQEQVLNYARQNAPAPAPPPRPSLATTGQALTGATGTAPETWSDIALGAGRGVAKEAASFLPLPMNPMQPPPSAPPTMEGVVAPYLGQSEGPGAQMAERAGRFASGAILPGGMVRRGLSVALPAAGAEVGRAAGGPYGELAGAVTGGLASGLGAGRQAANRAMASELLRGEKQAAYAPWDRADVIIQGSHYRNVVDDIRRTLAEDAATPGLHDAALAAFRTMEGAVGQNVSMKHIERMRQLAGDVTATPGNARFGRIMRERLDNVLDDVVDNPRLLVYSTGDPAALVTSLREGRALHQAQRRTEAIEGLVNRATNRAPQFSQSGMENALRTEFRQLIQSWEQKTPASREVSRAARARNMWTPEQREAIQRVAQGGSLGNVLRGVGRFAPKGPVSSGMLAAIASLIPGVGPAVAGGIAAAGAMGHAAARSATQRNVDRVYELVSRGQQRRPDRVRGQALARALLAGDQNRP